MTNGIILSNLEKEGYRYGDLEMRIETAGSYLRQ